MCFSENSFPHHLTVSRLRTNSVTPGIVSNKVNFLFLFVLCILVKVRISQTISSFKVIGIILE